MLHTCFSCCIEPHFPVILCYIFQAAPSQCSAPVIPRHSTIAFYRITYNSGDDVIVTCDASNDRFTLHCNNSRMWSGPEMSCREPVKRKIFGFYLTNMVMCSVYLTNKNN